MTCRDCRTGGEPLTTGLCHWFTDLRAAHRAMDEDPPEKETS